jgi:hypothetical protein
MVYVTITLRPCLQVVDEPIVEDKPQKTFVEAWNINLGLGRNKKQRNRREQRVSKAPTYSYCFRKKYILKI